MLATKSLLKRDSISSGSRLAAFDFKIGFALIYMQAQINKYGACLTN
ncbi:hypothetical protein FBR4_2289 [Lactiplantibacillus plantarum]|nr:Hypothetical protein zj316_2004 [Lactiplantibacillus plantarum ZJ316]AGL64351.2 hypothetical protein LBP_cg1605 [Lactiplantibacillus plantarum subsp. plantarum P-8]KZD94021.1 hypothetical protein FBR4_2289 [Lactiplantibacillus plantarum]KZU01701.1 hypothetical protein Nizo2258_0030 [Lactiplantibacillus plantarum]KZU76661.1 hypothetical protein Nizo3400_3121 [Lactiplantibacillus plantarum]